MAQRMMNNVAQWKLVLVLVICELWAGAGAADRITGTIRFLVFNRKLDKLVPLSANNGDFNANGCNLSDQYAIIIHGWREGTNTQWVKDMVSNFTAYRPGCLMMMQYANNSATIDYFGELLPHFNTLANALAAHLRRLESVGFDPAKALIFGFSMGAQLAIEGSRRYGLKKINRIDVCEPAGPGFDNNQQFLRLDPKQAAQHVQCIHTSVQFGTRRRDCHIDWNMGICGRDQPAAGPFPNGAHGLCPRFYNSAFKYRFLPVPKPRQCAAKRLAKGWPRELRMGYFCDVVNSGVAGELFSLTTKKYPFTDEKVFTGVIP